MTDKNECVSNIYDMNQDDLKEYYIPAFENIFIKDWDELSHGEVCDMADEFDSNIGLPKFFERFRERPPAHDAPIVPVWRERFKKLAGPHGKVFYKMLRIKDNG